MQEFELTTFLQTPGETAFVNLAVVSDLDKYLELREKLFAKLANSPYIKADMWAMFDQRCCTIRIPQMLKLGIGILLHRSHVYLLKDFYKFNIWREEPGVSDNSRVELFLYTARSREDQVTCDWSTLPC